MMPGRAGKLPWEGAPEDGDGLPDLHLALYNEVHSCPALPCCTLRCSASVLHAAPRCLRTQHEALPVEEACSGVMPDTLAACCMDIMLNDAARLLLMVACDAARPCLMRHALRAPGGRVRPGNQTGALRDLGAPGPARRRGGRIPRRPRRAARAHHAPQRAAAAAAARAGERLLLTRCGP